MQNGVGFFLNQIKNNFKKHLLGRNTIGWVWTNLCYVNLAKLELHFPEFPSPCSSGWGLAKREICLRLGRPRWHWAPCLGAGALDINAGCISCCDMLVVLVGMEEQPVHPDLLLHLQVPGQAHGRALWKRTLVSCRWPALSELTW